MNANQKINYVEFPANNLKATKAFFTAALGWAFEDFGEDYIAFDEQGINGGFYRSDLKSTVDSGGALIVIFSNSLELMQIKIEAAGGKIVKPIFSFPGGRRFHFTEPSGNELAVWSH